MNWKDQLNQAISTLRGVAESDTVKDITTKARKVASELARKVKGGALNAAEAFVEANSDPSVLKIRYLNADFSILSPSDGIEVTRPNPGSMVVSDGTGNGLVINASLDKPGVAEQWVRSKQLSGNTYAGGATAFAVKCPERTECQRVRCFEKRSKARG